MKVIKKSFGIIPVRFIDEGFEFLLLRAYNYWDFPKGEQQQDEDPLQTAIREMKEETGISSMIWRWQKVHIETAPYAKGKLARYYLAEVPAEVEVRLRPEPGSGIYEHHEWRWMSYDDAQKLLVPRLQEVLDWALTQIRSS